LIYAQKKILCFESNFVGMFIFSNIHDCSSIRTIGYRYW